MDAAQARTAYPTPAAAAAPAPAAVATPRAFAAPAAPAATAPTPNPVTQIRGIGSAWEAKLEAQGVKTPDDLLAKAGEPAGRRELATALSADPKTVLEWVNRADLFRIATVSHAQANLLEDAGVDTVKELGARNAANLAAKLKEAAGANAPSAETVAAWVEEAKGLAPKVSH
ncbi:MAG: DUF4332 domain-containing protein [Dehalococcoidia bacterium]